ncbi:MAG: 4Fe-4S binding protein [Spirochaetales bacterium]|nr:4Fe-4S binding protein [Spirochaetales bacterium]
MKRKIIEIDETKCNGCALCIPNCPEGAIQLIDGKARLLGDLFCDGLGACIGECPEGAITITEREAEPYDEAGVMENIIPQVEAVIRAHLDHLESHGETECYRVAVSALERHGLSAPERTGDEHRLHHEGCPGARAMRIENSAASRPAAAPQPSRLSTWPVQLHLLPPRAPYFKGRDLLLCADCVAYAAGDFHERYLKDGVLTIACPKLDDGQEIYLEKLTAILAEGGVRSLTVLTMEVPCCTGLARLAGSALAASGRSDIRAEWKVVNLRGDELKSAALAAE